MLQNTRAAPAFGNRCKSAKPTSRHRIWSGMAAILILHGCSGADAEADADAGKTPEPLASTEQPGFAPGESLAFEWSANGFEQLPAEYKWTGSGKRDDVFQPHLSLSVPETDDTIWSSECSGAGKVKTTLYLNRPEDMKGNSADFRFETDTSTKTLQYPARYVSGGQYDGFEIVTGADDKLFADMKTGAWAYMQIGEGEKATKLRVSLARADKALGAFVPACSAPQKRTEAPKTPVVKYRCEDGRTVQATYLGNETDTPVVRLEIDGAVHLMQQAVSGSGARYVSDGDGTADQSLTWHTKGSSAIFSEAGNDPAGNPVETSVTCGEL